ncbi:hypothetical protein HW555_000363 [Spodoptera exigua]|uniref:Uncharacterized protein n=1 Tax=Spodoptera exigua TaxID=7107 RepID=A0A835GRJ9_SPOEX|nr:hypothetical protein HW555_000363 [Spodoptera exigua]
MITSIMALNLKMNRRGRCMVDLVKKVEQQQRCETDINEKNVEHPDPVDAPNEERLLMQLLPSGPDLPIDTTPNVTDDPVNIPSLSSLISISDSEFSNSPNPSSSRKRKPTYKTDLGRKRKRHIKDWVDLSDHTKQWEFINKFTKRFDKKRMTTENPSRRKFTTKYYLPLPTDDSTFETQQVCLKMFCGTLAITDQIIRTAHSKLDSCGITSSDNRGKHLNHPKKIDDEMIRSVCDHVKSFQPVESHYTRKNTNWPELSKYNNTAETERQYRTIVNDHMNIAFFIPKKDLCDKCHAFSNEVSPTEEQVLAHNKHILNKEPARKYKAKDKEEAIQNSILFVAAVDIFDAKLVFIVRVQKLTGTSLQMDGCTPSVSLCKDVVTVDSTRVHASFRLVVESTATRPVQIPVTYGTDHIANTGCAGKVQSKLTIWSRSVFIPKKKSLLRRMFRDGIKTAIRRFVADYFMGKRDETWK